MIMPVIGLRPRAKETWFRFGMSMEVRVLWSGSDRTEKGAR